MPSHYNSLIFPKPSRFGYNQRRKDLTRALHLTQPLSSHASRPCLNTGSQWKSWRFTGLPSWKCIDSVHPGRITWNLKITQLNRKIIFQTIIFRFHVNLPGCTHCEPEFWQSPSNTCWVDQFFQSTRQQQLPCVELHNDTSRRPQIRAFIPTSVLETGQDEDFAVTLHCPPPTGDFHHQSIWRHQATHGEDHFWSTILPAFFG